MTLSRGTLRLWIVLSAFWVIIVGGYFGYLTIESWLLQSFGYSGCSRYSFPDSNICGSLRRWWQVTIKVVAIGGFPIGMLALVVGGRWIANGYKLKEDAHVGLSQLLAPVRVLTKPIHRPYRYFANYVQRHWRGEIPLAIAVFVNIFFVNVVLFAAFTLVEMQLGSVLGSAMFVVVATMLGVTVLIWQVVGTLRVIRMRLSGPIHGAGNRLSTFAAIAVVVLLSAGGVYSAVQNYTLTKKLAGDMLAPRSYSVDVWSFGDLKVLAIMGDIGPGLAADVRDIMLHNDGIDSVAIDSPGGFVVEAFGVARLIEEHGLEVEVFDSGQCLSACTLVLAAGNSRRRGPGAVIGFHRASTGGVSRDGSILVDWRIARFLLSRGISEDFVNRVNSIPSDEMWYPEVAELIEAGFLDGPSGTAGRRAVERDGRH